jgi:hypothetical protein
LNARVRKIVIDQASRVLGSGVESFVQEDEVRPEFVQRIVAAWLAEYGHEGMLTVTETAEGALIQRSLQARSCSRGSAGYPGRRAQSR